VLFSLRLDTEFMPPLDSFSDFSGFRGVTGLVSSSPYIANLFQWRNSITVVGIGVWILCLCTLPL